MAIAAPSIITLRGEFDIHNQAALEQALAPAWHVRDVIIDFTGVPYIDSSALSVLIRMHKKRNSFGYEPARFAGLQRSLTLIFHVSGLEHVWPRFETVDDAVASFSKIA